MSILFFGNGPSAHPRRRISLQQIRDARIVLPMDHVLAFWFRRCALMFAGLVGGAAFASAQIVIRFDEIAAFSLPGEQYAGLGVHFGSGPAGVQNGLTNGDTGNWLLDGTAGPFFLGFNGTPSYSETVTFDFGITSVSLDVSRANGSAPTDTFTLTAFSGASLVDSQTITLSNAINVWSTVTVSASNITSVQILGGGAGFHPFGVDRFQFIPEPSVTALLAVGLIAAAAVRRRR